MDGSGVWPSRDAKKRYVVGGIVTRRTEKDTAGVARRVYFERPQE